MQPQTTSQKVICMIGVTGTGKSATSNSISGQQDLFQESSKMQSCTDQTIGKECNWFSKQNNEKVFIIDTPGFFDSKGRDTENITNMVAYLKQIGHVNTFVICINSLDTRLDENKQSILKLLREIFGEGFYKHIMICFTRWSYDPKEIKKRTRKDITQSGIVTQFSEQLQSILNIEINEKQFMFIDNDYNNEEVRQLSDEQEIEQNQVMLDKLLNLTLQNTAFQCQDIKVIMKENDQLKSDISEAQNQIDIQAQILKEKERKNQELLEEAQKQEKILQEQKEKQIQMEKQRQQEIQAEKLREQQREKERANERERQRQYQLQQQREREQQQQRERERQQREREREEEQRRERQRIQNQIDEENEREEKREKERRRRNRRGEEQDLLHLLMQLQQQQQNQYYNQGYYYY